MKRTWLLIVALGLFLFILLLTPDWTAAKRLTWNSGDSMNPDLAVDSEFNFHVVCMIRRPDPLKSITGGARIWAYLEPHERLDLDCRRLLRPDIAIDFKRRTPCRWHDYTPGLPDIYYRESADGG